MSIRIDPWAAACVAVVLLITASIVAALARRRLLLKRFRATCASLGLRREPDGWRGIVQGIEVSVAWVEYTARNNRPFAFTSYRAKLEPPLGAGLALYAKVRRFADEKTTAAIKQWEKRDDPLPPRFRSGDDRLDRSTAMFAHDQALARARLLPVAGTLDGLARELVDVCVTDHAVELLATPYDNRPEHIEPMLAKLTALAAALRHRERPANPLTAVR